MRQDTATGSALKMTYRSCHALAGKQPPRQDSRLSVITTGRVCACCRYRLGAGAGRNHTGRGSARSGQPSLTAVPEALTISMLLPMDS